MAHPSPASLQEKRSLAAILRGKGTLGVTDAVDVVLDVCDELANAHQNGVVHGDLGVHRVRTAWPRFPGDPLDIYALGETDTAAFEARALAGSVLVAPEMRDRRIVDARADIFAVGVMLHWLIAGRAPGLAPVARSLESAPRPIVALIEACLQDDPACRPQSVDEVAAALGSFATSPPERFAQVARRHRAFHEPKRGPVLTEEQDVTLGRLEEAALSREITASRVPPSSIPQETLVISVHSVFSQPPRPIDPEVRRARRASSYPSSQAAPRPVPQAPVTSRILESSYVPASANGPRYSADYSDSRYPVSYPPPYPPSQPYPSVPFQHGQYGQRSAAGYADVHPHDLAHAYAPSQSVASVGGVGTMGSDSRWAPEPYEYAYATSSGSPEASDYLDYDGPTAHADDAFDKPRMPSLPPVSFESPSGAPAPKRSMWTGVFGFVATAAVVAFAVLIVARLSDRHLVQSSSPRAAAAPPAAEAVPSVVSPAPNAPPAPNASAKLGAPASASASASGSAQPVEPPSATPSALPDAKPLKPRSGRGASASAPAPARPAGARINPKVSAPPPRSAPSDVPATREAPVSSSSVLTDALK